MHLNWRTPLRMGIDMITTFVALRVQGEWKKLPVLPRCGRKLETIRTQHARIVVFESMNLKSPRLFTVWFDTRVGNDAQIQIFNNNNNNKYSVNNMEIFVNIDTKTDRFKRMTSGTQTKRHTFVPGAYFRDGEEAIAPPPWICIQGIDYIWDTHYNVFLKWIIL
jgi:hypothetical protein